MLVIQPLYINRLEPSDYGGVVGALTIPLIHPIWGAYRPHAYMGELTRRVNGG